MTRNNGMNPIDVQGKVVIITGSAQGLGAATAKLCSLGGAKLVLADIGPADAVLEDIRSSGGEAIYAPLDVRSPEQWDSVVQAALEQFGRIDGLVNNAGVSHRVDLFDTTSEDWNKVMDINLSGTFYGIRAVGAAMEGLHGGSIVNISSSLGLIGHAAAAYSTSKWAVRGLTRSACGSLAEKNVRVNSVHPGMMRTPMAVAGSNAYLEANIGVTPLGRLGDSEEIAAVIAFLLSDFSTYVTGAEIAVDGGYAAFGGQMGVTKVMKDFEKARLSPEPVS